MNVLFLTLLDFNTIEERGLYTDLMREFVKKGHHLYIISPREKRKREPTKLLDHGQVKILKLQIGNIQKTNIFEKGFSTLTLESRFVRGIQKYFRDVKFDLVLYSTPPITLQKAVEFVKKRDSAKSYLLLKDIFPQNAVDLGMLTRTGVKGLIHRFFRAKEESLYRQSDFIGCMSKANIDFLLKHNPKISSMIVEECPNSIDPVSVGISDEGKDAIRNRNQIPTDKTVFIYGGNLGKPQGIDFLIDCVRANENSSDSFFLIVGSGTEYSRLKSFINEEEIANTRLLSQLPKEDYDLLVNSCDAGLIFLDKSFTIPNFPSRLLSYMQASMPILAATDRNTDIGEVIEAGNFGYWCESGDLDAFKDRVRKLTDKALREKMGRNARKYLEEHYTSKHSYEIIMRHFSKEEKR